MKQTATWYSRRVEQEVRLVRWGHYGTPVLLFPTAGGDAEEVERFHLVQVVQPLIDAGKVKIYSTDSIAGRAWTQGNHPPEYCSALQNRFDALVYHEITPAIRSDCLSGDIEIVAAGASIGAFNAVAIVCRHPDAYKLAIGMSGTYDLSRFAKGHFDRNLYFSSPLNYLPGLEGPQLELLRKRFILMPTGEGNWEDPGESWRMASALGAKGIPNRVDPWGPRYHHDWDTWREMLPRYLAELA